MPTAYIKTLAREGKGTVAELEKKWDRARTLAAEEDHAEDYAYITGIFNRMIGKKKAAFGSVAGFNAGTMQEDVNYDITDRMEQSTQRRPAYRLSLAGALDSLTPDMVGKDNPFKNTLSSGSNFMNGSMVRGKNDGDQWGFDGYAEKPDPVARPSDPVKKDLMPDEKTTEEKEAERIADKSLGNTDLNLVRTTGSAMERIWRMFNAETSI